MRRCAAVVAGLLITLLMPGAAWANEEPGPVKLAISVPSQAARGHSAELVFTVTNRGAKPCSVAAKGDGALQVVAVKRNGQPIAPSWGERLYHDSYASAVLPDLREVTPGAAASFPVEIGAGVPLSSVDPVSSSSALLGRWWFEEPGKYEVTARYAVPGVPGAGLAVCEGLSNAATVTFTVEEKSSSRYLIIIIVAAVAALAIAIVVLLIVRRRKGPAAAVAVLLAIGLSPALAQRPARADIVVPPPATAGFMNAVDGCLNLMRANDPAGIMAYFDGPSSPTVTIRPARSPQAMETDGDSGNPSADITVKWYPENKGLLTSGLAYDPCGGLQHEMSHAHDFAQNQAKNNTTECDSTGVPIGEVKAIAIENVIRGKQGALERRHFGADRVPSTTDRCNDPAPPRSPRPAGFAGSCEQNSSPQLDSGGGCAMTTGDPHLTTFDGRYYDLQSVGEFVAVRSSTQDLEIQTRQTAMPGSRLVSVNSAVAVRAGSTRLGFYLSNGSLITRRDGQPVTASPGETKLPGGVTLERRASIFPAAGDGYTVTWADGTVLWVDRIAVAGLAVAVKPARQRAGSFAGLMGDFNGSPGNDLVIAGGAMLGESPSFEQLHRHFADSWRVSPVGSLFDYAAGQSTATFTDKTFPDRSTTPSDLDPQAVERAKRLCASAGVAEGAAMDACVLDVTLTGQASFALAAAAGSRMMAPRPATQTQAKPGTTIADGAVVNGNITTPNTSDRYPLNLAGATQFFVTAWKGPAAGCDQTFSVNLVGVSANNYPCAGGKVAFHVPSSGSYQLEIVSPKGSTGTYSFTVVTVKPRPFTATAGDRITGSIDLPGRVDVYTFTATAAAFTLEDLPTACTDTTMSYTVRRVGNGDVVGGRLLCGTPAPMTLPEPNGQYRLEIHSEALATGAYAFRLR